MKWVKAVVTFLATMILGMFGGQKEKGARRFGIFGFAMAINWRRAWPLVLLIPVLCLGYGENSIFMEWFNSEILVRAFYALLLSIPFYFYGWKRGLVASVLLIGAFQIHAGSLGHISWFGDFLVEDILRYGVLGILIAFNVCL